MGKRIIAQRRGRGGRYVSPSHRFKAGVKHISKDITGRVIDIIHCPGHTAPLAQVKYGDSSSYILCPEGIMVGDLVSIGNKVDIKNGNTTFLKNIPEGSLVYNIESIPGDGGKFVRSSGTSARLVSKTKDSVKLILPSKNEKLLNPNCKATIGVVAGGGRLEKPFVKAGKKWHAMRARGRLYPKTSAVAMNAVDHPFGSGRGRHEGKPTIAPRFAPPGRKVGQVAARRTGKKR